MDHRVSKDMISSGMTPSGQRSQADLGRTQYGSAPSPNSLMDAYHSMYAKEKEETLDEGKIPAGLQAYLDKKKGKKGDDKKDEKKEDKKDMKEGMGLYANIHAKKKRGEKMRKKGDKGAPSSQDFKNAAKTAKEETEIDLLIASGKFSDAEIAKIQEAMGVFKDPKLNKKYPNQPEMTDKGKKILPKLNDPTGLGSRFTKNSRPFGVSQSTNDALKMINQ